MRITCIWSRDKNPIIEIEEKQPKHQNPQKSYVRKSHVKCMKMWINWKRRVKRDLLVLEDKNLWKIEAENDKEI